MTTAAEAEAIGWITRACADNPIATLLGAKPLACDPVTGRIAIAFAAKPEFCNLLGSLQGDMLAAMLYMVMSFSVLCTVGGLGLRRAHHRREHPFPQPSEAGAHCRRRLDREEGAQKSRSWRDACATAMVRC